MASQDFNRVVSDDGAPEGKLMCARVGVCELDQGDSLEDFRVVNYVSENHVCFVLSQ